MEPRAFSPPALPPARSRLRKAVLLALAVALGPAAPGIVAGPPRGRAGHAPAEVPRVKRLQPRRSLAHLADWFLARGKPLRAWEMVAFALLHDPRDPDLLGRAAALNLRLGDLPSARLYATRALEARPRDRRARELLREIRARTPAPGEGAAGASDESTAPAEGPPAEESAAASEGTTPPPSLEDRLRALSLLKLVRSAVTAYNLRHPREPLEEFDLEALRGDGILPADYEHEALPRVSWADGEASLEGLGSLSELEEGVGSYLPDLREAAEWLERGEPYEALRDVERLEARYGRTTRLWTLRQRALRAISPERAAAEARAQAAEVPGVALQKALDLWRDGDRRAADQELAGLLERWPDSAHGPVVRHLRRLLREGYSLDGLLDFYEARQRTLAEARSRATTATTTAPAEGEGDAPDP